MPQWLIDSPWLYNGGATGARTLLGAVASSTIGVAGTVFSITIAALSLAAGQMGPRLLRNFTRDRGNQLTLGAFLGTFSYALMVLRSVRTQSEGAFVPHLSLSVGILLAFVCVGTLVFFVGHMAGRINVDTVVELVSEDVRARDPAADARRAAAAAAAAGVWRGARRSPTRAAATCSSSTRTGWRTGPRSTARTPPAGAARRLRVPRRRRSPRHAAGRGRERAIRAATALGGQRVSASDLEFAMRQLVEVAVRALSPGINDPHTAMSVLDRLGAALCDAAPLHLPTGVTLRDGRPRWSCRRSTMTAWSTPCST